MEEDKPKEGGQVPGPSGQTFRDTLRRVEQEPAKVLERFPNLTLAEQLAVWLLASGRLRQDLILTSPLAAELVPMLPEQEIYLTLKEIGLEDATPTIALMSREQLHYLNDLEAWEKERFEVRSFLKLLRIIRHCGEDKLAQWLNDVDPELLVLFLKNYGRVTKYDITRDPIEETDEQASITYDGYYRVHPKRQEFAPLLAPVLRILKTCHPERFGMVMESAYKDLPAEVEEEALRFRSSRLSEIGMPDFENACEIYRRLTDEKFMEYAADTPALPQPAERTPALYPIRWLPAESFFLEVLQRLGDHPDTDRIRSELASLGNKVLVADGLEVTSVESLKAALRKVADTLTLALEYLEGDDAEKAAAWLTRTWLHHLFRLGHSQVLKLAERARRIRNRAGFPWIDRFHYLADSPFEETLRGLLMPRPLFFEGQREQDGQGFRDFAGMDDLRIASERTAAVEAMARFFEQPLGLPPEKIKQICLEAGLGDRLDTVRWSQVLHTLWACRTLTGKPAFRPLRPAEVQPFIRAAFSGAPGTPTRGLDPEFTLALVRWCQERMAPLAETTEAIVDAWIRAGSRGLEQELKGFDPEEPIDSRFIQCLCVHEQTLDEGKR
jgi:hypothetical protein